MPSLMFRLTEGEKDPRPFVPAGFILPDFERRDVVVRSVQSSFFLRPTGQNVGPREIQQVVCLNQEYGEGWLDVQVGVDAGGLWFKMERLEKIYEREINRLLSQLPGRVVELERSGHFDLLTHQMQREYQSGLEFTRELAPKFLDQFPSYGLVIDRFKSNKSVMFVDGDTCQKAVSWRVDFGEFAIRVGEVMEVSPSDEVDLHVFEANGRKYWPHNWVKVWYPTESRDTTYDVDDANKRTKLLQESLDTLASFLKVNK